MCRLVAFSTLLKRPQPTRSAAPPARPPRLRPAPRRQPTRTRARPRPLAARSRGPARASPELSARARRPPAREEQVPQPGRRLQPARPQGSAATFPRAPSAQDAPDRLPSPSAAHSSRGPPLSQRPPATSRSVHRRRARNQDHPPGSTREPAHGVRDQACRHGGQPGRRTPCFAASPHRDQRPVRVVPGRMKISQRHRTWGVGEAPRREADSRRGWHACGVREGGDGSATGGAPAQGEVRDAAHEAV